MIAPFRLGAARSNAYGLGRASANVNERRCRRVSAAIDYIGRRFAERCRQRRGLFTNIAKAPGGPLSALNRHGLLPR